MKTQKVIDTNLILRLLIVPVICALAFAGCSSDGDGMAGTHATADFQNAVTDDTLSIDPDTSAPSSLMTRIGR